MTILLSKLNDKHEAYCIQSARSYIGFGVSMKLSEIENTIEKWFKFMHHAKNDSD